jgi:hypothetical protein
MATLNDTPEWIEAIYELATNDPVSGGPYNPTTKAGVDNHPHEQIARRTSWLKETLANLTADAMLRADLTLIASVTAGAIRLPANAQGFRPTLQWVTGQSNAGGVMALTLPVAFPTAILGGIADEANPSGWGSTGRATVWSFDLAGSTKTFAVARSRDVSPNDVRPTAVAGRILCWGY